ncbi:MAG TPA: ABC transporter ATP-binding protein [Bacteroidales bacterium]|nr:ABC transporter ATP-binding protein [Bacteroidales bacterium]HRW34371.1 ABC transporter ATP-binding protein [Thermotogota bacterium]
MNPTKLSVKNITYYYDKFKALNNMSFNLEENQIMGLIGRNGSGKTTLLKVIAHQLLQSNGEIIIDQKNFIQSIDNHKQICLARETLGKTFEMTEVMKLKMIFDLAANLYEYWDRDYAQYLIKRFKLGTNKKYNKISKGMKTTVGIIIGLASRAPITLFDEPYVGLDPVSREIFYAELQKDYSQNPRTFIISSHLINELEGMFERVLIIDEGEIIIDSPIDALKDRYYLLQGRKASIESYRSHFKVMNTEIIGSLASYSIEGPLNEQIMRQMKTDEIDISMISLQKLLYYLTNGGENNEER